MKGDLYIIEKRHPDGSLDLSAPQPEDYFGFGAIHGMTYYEMGQAIFRTRPDAVLDGQYIQNWPVAINPNFFARRKTW